jgi:hypothetical protein
MTTFIESSYATIAAEIERNNILTDRLLVERSLIASRFSGEDKTIQVVRNNILNTIDNELAALAQSTEGFSSLLTQKLAEPVEEKLGLGKISSLVPQ